MSILISHCSADVEWVNIYYGNSAFPETVNINMRAMDVPIIDMSDEDEASKCVGDAWCVVTYGGSKEDAVINYATLAVQLAVNLKFFLASQGGLTRSSAAVHGAVLFLVTFYQIGLCVMIGCSGVRDVIQFI